MGVSKNMRYPKMDGLSCKTLSKWMIWGYPYFRKPPNVDRFCSCQPPSPCSLGSLLEHPHVAQGAPFLARWRAAQLQQHAEQKHILDVLGPGWGYMEK